MPLADFKEMLKDAKKNKYAVPCLIAGNIEMALGQVMAAEEKRSPVILAFPPHVMPEIPSKLFIPFINNVAKCACTPVAVQLDHGYEYTEIVRCIHNGASAVMFDGSELPYEENVSKTRELVKVAHSLDADVEAELGYVGGSLSHLEGKSSELTDPEKVADFVAATNVDALAVSFGNLHGKYRGEPKLDIERLRRISALVDIPLVMHGGSGLTADDYRKVAANGISDIHFYSSLAANVWAILVKKAGETGREPIYHEIISWIIEYYYEEAKKVIDMLDSAGKAVPVCDNSIYFELIDKYKKDNAETRSEDISTIIRNIVSEALRNLGSEK